MSLKDCTNELSICSIDIHWDHYTNGTFPPTGAGRVGSVRVGRDVQKYIQECMNSYASDMQMLLGIKGS